MMLALLVPLLLCAPIVVADVKPAEVELSSNSDVGEVSEEYLARGFNWIGDRFLGVVESLVPDERAGRANGVEGRRRKKKVRLNKYVFPLIVGFLLMKSVILPLALKALAILSGKAVVLSIMSLILAAIVGLRSMAGGGGGGFGLTYAQSKADLTNAPVAKYRRKDILDHPDQIEDDPYNRYYSERRRRRRK